MPSENLTHPTKRRNDEALESRKRRSLAASSFSSVALARKNLLSDTSQTPPPLPPSKKKTHRSGGFFLFAIIDAPPVNSIDACPANSLNLWACWPLFNPFLYFKQPPTNLTVAVYKCRWCPSGSGIQDFCFLRIPSIGVQSSARQTSQPNFRNPNGPFFFGKLRGAVFALSWPTSKCVLKIIGASPFSS